MNYKTNTITGDVKLSDEQASELQAQVGIYYNHAIGYHQGEMGAKARMAWEYYYGRLPEPVTMGSSSWVDRTVWEAVNGTLQELVSVFTSGEDAVRFAPMHAQDGNAARAATKMVNKILLRDNKGFNVLHDAFKECLVVRNSFVKRYWTEEERTFTEKFEGLSKEELDIYLAQLDGDILEFTTEEEETEDGELSNVFNGEVTYEKKYEGVRVEFVPFEQVCVEPTATTLRDCNFICHRVRKSKDELYQLGFDKETVKGLNPASSDIESGIIGNARVNNITPLNVSDVLSVGDEHADKLWLHENYLRSSCVNGRMEIYQIFTIHNQILEVNRINEMPFETFTPFPTPGSIWGESVFDITKDIQDLTTALIRGIIDNIQNANFRRYQAVKGQYDRASLLNNRPGGVVEVSQINAVVPFEYHQLPGGINELLIYVEGKKEERTGVSKLGQGLDPNVFKNDNAFATVNMMMTASQNRLRMIARNIAQRGMMDLMSGIYDLVRMNGTEQIAVDTPNGQQMIDPRLLPKREDLIVAVAVGDAERKERAQSLQSAMMMFNQVPQMTQFFQPNNAYMLATQLFESMGIYDVENFITPLDQIPPPQPNPAEELQLQMLQAQLQDVQAKTQKVVSDTMQEAQLFEFEQFKAADDVNIRKEESLSKQDLMVDQMRIEERKLQIEESRLRLKEMELRLKEQEIMIEAQLESSQQRPVGLGRS
ncbi:MAG: portal protein [Bacteroidales bacterium]